MSSQKSINADFFVSLQPQNKRPTSETNDYSTTSIVGSNYHGGKTLQIPSFELENKNPSCKDSGFSEDQPCAIYIGVLCESIWGCKLTMEIDYSTDKPRRVYSG